MTLDEVINAAQPCQFFGRKKWRELGLDWMKLLNSKTLLEDLPSTLTVESWHADDWELYEVMK